MSIDGSLTPGSSATKTTVVRTGESGAWKAGGCYCCGSRATAAGRNRRGRSVPHDPVPDQRVRGTVGGGHYGSQAKSWVNTAVLRRAWQPRSHLAFIIGYAARDTTPPASDDGRNWGVEAGSATSPEDTSRLHIADMNMYHSQSGEMLQSSRLGRRDLANASGVANDSQHHHRVPACLAL
ncbi:hypothetical protein ON010_g16904 [Phytophthora cinnamomi]|nr:hypothetical protein ON010_g16904 [Phytophthora cinnamomi]